MRTFEYKITTLNLKQNSEANNLVFSCEKLAIVFRRF